MSKSSQEIAEFTSAVIKTINEGKQLELAKHCGVSAKTIERWTSGLVAPHPMIQKEVLEWVKAN